ncbi:hypothetical protein JQK87_16985 [Streptomyces sp. G44]|uniref:hypothetical protein n=1 Tax=Streptomyces sp. G44 TaxID=2807632 RepID=UPI001961C339|nr:hypothetical protein [Streptomyces sp. G44]MBM7170077.1 hypothetical protein [Streptomyces sp. G44]
MSSPRATGLPSETAVPPSPEERPGRGASPSSPMLMQPAVAATATATAAQRTGTYNWRTTEHLLRR